MTTNINIKIDNGVKVTVVPQYLSLKRKTGQLLKDFGLLQHQRKAVHNLITQFMHANSHQFSLGKTAPSEIETHNNGLRKSQSLGCIPTLKSEGESTLQSEDLNTIKQGLLASPLPLTNTDFESDDDTPHTTTTHTQPTTQPALDSSTQSHENGAVIVNINTVETESPEVKELRWQIYDKNRTIDELETYLNHLNPPEMSDYLKTLNKRMTTKYRRNLRERSSVYLGDIEDYDRKMSSFNQKRSEYNREHGKTIQELIEAKQERTDLEERLQNSVKSMKLEEPVSQGNDVITNEAKANEFALEILQNDDLGDVETFLSVISEYTDYDSFRTGCPNSEFNKWSLALKLFTRKVYELKGNEEWLVEPMKRSKFLFEQYLQYSKQLI